MAWEARLGLKRFNSLQWHLWEASRRQAEPQVQKRKGLGEVSLQSSGGLLQSGDRQGLSRAQAQIVGVVADLAMRPPRPVGHALELAMSRQAALFARHPRNEERLASQANHSGLSGSKGSRPCLG